MATRMTALWCISTGPEIDWITFALHGFQSKYAAVISFIAQNSSRVSWWVSDRPKRLLNAISRNVSWSMNRETDGSVVVGIAFSNEHLFNKYIIIYQSTKMMNDFPFCPSSVGDNIIHIVSSCWALSPYHFNMYEKGKIYRSVLDTHIAVGTRHIESRIRRRRSGIKNEHTDKWEWHQQRSFWLILIFVGLDIFRLVRYGKWTLEMDCGLWIFSVVYYLSLSLSFRLVLIRSGRIFCMPDHIMDYRIRFHSSVTIYHGLAHGNCCSMITFFFVLFHLAWRKNQVVSRHYCAQQLCHARMIRFWCAHTSEFAFVFR